MEKYNYHLMISDKLRDLLRERKLKIGGSKPELIARLEEYDKQVKNDILDESINSLKIEVIKNEEIKNKIPEDEKYNNLSAEQLRDLLRERKLKVKGSKEESIKKLKEYDEKIKIGIPDEEKYIKMKAEELRIILRKYDLKTGGNKKELTDRIIKHEKNIKIKSENNDDQESEDEENIEGCDILENTDNILKEKDWTVETKENLTRNFEDRIIILKHPNVQQILYSEENPKYIYEVCMNNPELKKYEIWVKIPEELEIDGYMVSTYGNVLDKNLKDYLTPITHNGYKKCSLVTINEKSRNFYIHRLIALTFIPNSNNLKYVDHINRNKFSNNIWNLRWVTNSENNLNRPVPKNIKAGKPVLRISIKNINGKMEETGETKIYRNQRDAAIELGCDSKLISQVCCNGGGITQGYKWRFYEEPDLEGEIWKEIPTKYSIKGHLVSSHGRFKTPENIFIDGHIHNRYIRISICDITFSAHRIVCETFNGEEPFLGAVVMHLDNNPQNNHKDNLKWGTSQENTQSAVDDGLIFYKGNSLAVIAFDLKGNIKYKTESKKEMTELLEFSTQTANKMLNNKREYKGYFLSEGLILQKEKVRIEDLY